MDLAQLFIPFLKFTGIYITSFWSGGFTTPSAVNQINWNLENYIFVHFEITFLTTLTGILDFANLIFQTWILQARAGRKIQFKQGQKSRSSNSIFQTGELQQSNADRYMLSDYRIVASRNTCYYSRNQIFNGLY